MFSFVKSITLTKTQALYHCATRGYFNAANLGGVRVALYSPQHNEIYEISAFYAEMFIFYFLWSVNSCPIKALTVASVHSVTTGRSQ